MSKRKPLSQIIERVPSIKKGKSMDYVQDTINLEESIKDENREDTVRLYHFAKTLKQAFEEILVAFSEPIGRGFWLTAEYGVGKSHFVATLACLLSDNSDQVWNCVHDKDVKNYQFQFKKRRLFPVVAGPVKWSSCQDQSWIFFRCSSFNMPRPSSSAGKPQKACRILLGIDAASLGCTARCIPLSSACSPQRTHNTWYKPPRI